MSNELLLSVAACPGLLADWCGPARDDQGREVMCTGAVERVGTENGLSAFVMDANTGVRWWAPLATLSLDLSRAECRDRVCRVMAERLGDDGTVSNNDPVAIKAAWMELTRGE